MKLTNKDKDILINKLTDNLPVLRAKLRVSQKEVSTIIGISRQTYSAIETRKRKMSWNTFLSLMFYFIVNEETAKMMDTMGILTVELNDFLTKSSKTSTLSR